MEIIKSGDKKKLHKEGQCPRCGCIFSFERKDVYVNVLVGQFVSCPECGTRCLLTNEFLF